MSSLIIAALKLLRTLLASFKDSEFRVLLFITTMLLFSGSIFYHSVEGWSIIDSLYFCVMTMSTVGHDAFIPSNNMSKIFTMIYTLSSVGIFITLVVRMTKVVLKK